MDKKTIQPVSEEVREAIRRKSASALPSNPSAAGMSPGDIKKAFYSPMIDPEDSLLGEIDRVANEAGAAVQDLYERDQSTREKMYGDGGSEDEPKEGSFAMRMAESEKSIQKMGEEKVSFTDYATGSKAGVVKVSQGSATNIGITDGLIKVLKATEEHIAARDEDYTDYVLTASKTNAIVKAALTDKKKMALLDGEKATARETLGAASTEDVNGMRLVLSVDDDFKLTVSLLNTKNEVISVSNEIDLPIEEMVIGIDVNENEDGYILKLKTGETVPLSAEAIVRGFAKQETLDAVIEDIEALKNKGVELAPTLNGNEADKAPSVQAVNAELANALKCEKSGASVVLTDISPITHSLKVSVEGAEDPSSVKVLVPRKNLYNPDAWQTISATAYPIKKVTIDGIDYVNVHEGSQNYYKIPGDASTRYMFSLRVIRNSDFVNGTNLKATKPDGTTRHLAGWQNAEMGNGRSVVVYGGEKIHFDGYAKSDICVNINSTQLELGTSATKIEPFDPTEYPVNAGGTVDGIESIYPSMVLMTNTTDATIKCEYNRDAAKYADKVDGKLDISPGTGNRIYAQQNGAPRFLGYALVNVASNVVLYGGTNNGETDYGGSLQTTTPVKPYNCANKKYVDDTSAAIRTELGKQVFTVSQGQYGNQSWYVPNGALPNFYLETTLFEYSYEVDGVYGENFAKGNFTELTFCDENDNVLDTKPATSQTFYEMPSGTAKIHHNGVYLDHNPPWDYAVMHLPDLKFQVKVGT